MKLFAIAFLLGVSSIYCFTSIPPLWSLAALSTCLATLCLLPPCQRGIKGDLFKCTLAFSLGLLWILYCSQQILSWTLPPDKISVPVSIEGSIDTIPVKETLSLSFIFHMTRFEGQPVDTKLKLAFYKTPKNTWPDFKVGQQWRLIVKLKPPHNLKNPGSFDVERFDFANGIRATGYVVTATRRCEEAQPTRQSRISISPSILDCFVANPAPRNDVLKSSINHLREKLLSNLQHHLAGKPYAPFIYALTIGEKTEITQAEWQVFQNTGTNHLMAIAGLHIGFLAGLIFFLAQFIWKRIPGAALRVPSPLVGAIASLISAFFYAALAGFAIPTQRALVMLLVFLLGVLYRRKLSAFQSLSLALIAVLIWDPLSVLTISFWLSFGAITLLVFGLSARFNMDSLWWKHGRTQWVVSVGLIPLTLLFFSNASLISPVANSIAIPIVGFVTVPLSLLGALLTLVNAEVAHVVLVAAEWTLHPVWWVLSHLSAIPFFAWQHLTQNPLWIAPAIFGMFVILAPRGIPQRYLGFIFIAPLLWNPVPHPKPQAVWVNVLEVGQGLSAVIQTAHHVLIFDAGPKFNESYDMGRMVILPLLAYQGISNIDAMVISHPHDDHMGGAGAVLQAFPHTSVITSAVSYFKDEKVSNCWKGEAWNWDGVHFEFLHPTPADNLDDYNNNSCVLKVSLGHQQLLLTGDIEKPAEIELLEEGAKLKSTMIVVPHHGSKTSSSDAFLKAVDPQYAFIPVGYLNRFHFPHAVVVERYRVQGVRLFDTASDGMISVRWEEGSQQPQISIGSEQKKYIWN